VQTDWRSRDLFNAWQPNIIALMQMLNKYIYLPNKCTIARIIDRCNSLHIYRGDIELAKTIIAQYLPQSMQ